MLVLRALPRTVAVCSEGAACSAPDGDTSESTREFHGTFQKAAETQKMQLMCVCSTSDLGPARKTRHDFFANKMNATIGNLSFRETPPSICPCKEDQANENTMLLPSRRLEIVVDLDG